ncbi:hypothetical protein ACJRO7_021031 [Eucalyptus globulus]|uniref:TIR domain-containing protein n=1 Tax=Eucalyptus globulus TaxID=34317 RepID=A0ABD3KIF5_EUCGL
MASSSKAKSSYEVFLSFRGTDLRNTFLGHLYKALYHNGIYTFIDSEELKKGDQILPTLMKAIEESCVAIIIFSEDYASSQWCLEEVMKIMECKEQKDLTVLPVFYKVDPREVRWGSKSYEKALAKRESRLGKDSKKVKRWKKALFDASCLSGWHLNDGDESELIERIVKEISTLLDRKPLHVAKHPVGIDSRVVKLKSMLNLESDDGVLMMGLWGKGGIGKTSLAKAIYNDIFRQFEGSAFLANVRETSTDCRDLVALQEKLLSEILLLKRRLEVSNVDAGTNLVRDRLCRKKVLLILDDVDDLCQLNALAGEGKWFGNGSRIIITTRDKHLLICHGIDQDHVYEVKALEDREARELLSKHAFQMHQKLKIKKDLVDSVLKHAEGLPLAIEVLGSFLYGRREDEWKSTLKKLSTIPHKAINNVLKLSYDGLEDNEKEIFLHIACFFKGRDSEYIKKVIDSCDFEIAIGLEILIERSLISIEHGIVEMHDLIQLMGMDIVNQECRDDPWRRSRLWLYDDVLDVLSRRLCSKSHSVGAIKAERNIYCGPNAFTKASRLRLLIMHNLHNSFQGPICLPNEIRWFEWVGCASWFPQFSSGPKKLVGLDMSKSSITGMPKQFKDFQQLKYINFSNCESLVRMPDLSCTPNLEELVLCVCKNLVEAHESVAYHDKLQLLNLRGCKKFDSFPDIPCKLQGLKKLCLQGTAIRELPASIENLVSLKIMDLSNCKNLVSLPSSIYKLQNIEHLDLGYCTNLIEFPKYKNSADPSMKSGLSDLLFLSLGGCNLSGIEFLGNPSCFPFLQLLILAESNVTSLPTSIRKRDHLTIYAISFCHQLQEIPELPPFLKHLLANNCESLQKNGDSFSSSVLIRRVLTVADIPSLDQTPPDYIIWLPEGEMPEWVLPIEESFISFMASKDLYDQFLGVTLYIVFDNDDQAKYPMFEILPHVNGEMRNCKGGRSFLTMDSDQILLWFFTPRDLWGEVNFGQIDGSYVHFSLTISTAKVKKWGFRIICKPLEDNLKIGIQDNQLIDLALFREVVLDPTDLEVDSPLMHKDNLIKMDLQKDLQDCQRSSEEHSQIVSKANPKLILPHGMRTKNMPISNSTGRDEDGRVGLQLLLLE